MNRKLLPSLIALCSGLMLGCPPTAAVSGSGAGTVTGTTLLPVPAQNERMSLGEVTLGMVGVPIRRENYEITLDVVQPIELSCNFSYDKLLLDEQVPPGEAALLLSLRGPGMDTVCEESSFRLRKKLTCKIPRGGGTSRLKVQSGNPEMALAFGFLCETEPLRTRSPVKETREVAPPPPPRQVRAVRATGSGRSTAGGGEGSTGTNSTASPGKLAKQLEEVSEGRDEQHKLLTLVPCEAPLGISAGVATIGKGGPKVRFTVHKAKICQIEVAGVSDSALDPDVAVVLSP